VACCSDWNPAVDQHLVKNYNTTNFKAGKAACKAALQEELGLPVNPNIPLLAFIGRLDYQKGADIVLQVGQVAGCGSTLSVQTKHWVVLGRRNRHHSTAQHGSQVVAVMPGHLSY
jgi:hypothetical protein